MTHESLGPFVGRSAEELGFNTERIARLRTVADRYIDDGKTAGVVTAVLRDRALAWVDARGCRDLAAGSTMTSDTLFRIYSMTKPVTSAAVMLLVEATTLRLTDPVSRFFPEYREMEVYVEGEAPPFRTEAARREITIRDLLTHTSGLAYGIGDEHPVEKVFETEVWAAMAEDPAMTLREVARRVAGYPLVHQPGTHWRYSSSIDLLGAIVEEVAGVPFDAFLHERIFEPLGMEDTFFTVPQTKRGRLAGVYTRGDAGLEPIADPPWMSFTSPDSHPGGGGLVSTAADYLTFAQTLLNGGRGPDCDGRPGERILGPRTVAMMMSDHLPPNVAAWNTPGAGFGYGGQVVTDPGRFSGYGSPGRFTWGGAASTLFTIDPGDRLIFVVLHQIMPHVDDLSTDLSTTVFQAIEA